MRWTTKWSIRLSVWRRLARSVSRLGTPQWAVHAAFVSGIAASLITWCAVPTMASAQPRGTVRTDTLWAQALGIKKALTVYLPPSYASNASGRYPVLIYLHGLSGNERNWVDNGHLARSLDSLTAAGQPEAIVVMPDGDDSWYTTWAALPDVPACRADTTRRESADSYCVPWPHYDDYIAFDVVQHVDRTYRTKADRAHRGIAGLSMGGYGAVSIALRYPTLFAAAASHSGVLSPRLVAPGKLATTDAEFRTAARGLWRTISLAFGHDTIGWNAREPALMATRLASMRASSGAAAMPALLIDCGVDDPYVRQNREFHETLQRLGVSHQYAEWPGAHTWSYWSAHAVESVRFLLANVATP